MRTYSGVCRGGPYDGKRMGAPHREQKIAYPDPPLTMAQGLAAIKANETITYKRGFYRHEDGEWIWNAID